MTLHHASRMVTICLLLATTGASSFAVVQARPSYDPASKRPAGKRADSFVDFALKRINPSDKNYGQCIDEGRKFLLEETIENGYFWSNMVALGLLGCLFVIIVYQHNRQARREWIMAEALQQYEHALARANAHVDDATKRNHELMEALTGAGESALRSPIALLERGLARVEIAPDREECAPDLYEAEAKARAGSRGLWALPQYAVKQAVSLLPGLAGSFQLVEGQVTNVSVHDGRAFLDFHDNYRQGFSATVAPEDRKTFRKAGFALEDLAGRHVRLRGIVEDFAGRPEIALSNPFQIEILD